MNTVAVVLIAVAVVMALILIFYVVCRFYRIIAECCDDRQPQNATIGDLMTQQRPSPAPVAPTPEPTTPLSAPGYSDVNSYAAPPSYEEAQREAAKGDL